MQYADIREEKDGVMLSISNEDVHWKISVFFGDLVLGCKC